MRDIRSDLKERLGKIETERQAAKDRLDVLVHQEEALMALLREEESLWSSQQPNLFEEKANNESGKDRTELGSFIIRALATGEPLTLDQLKKVAEERGFDFGGKQPGRVMHFALLGMAQNDQVEMVEKGVWKLKSAGGSNLGNGHHPKAESVPTGGSPKHLIAEFIKQHGPSSRGEIMKGSGAAAGSVSYSLKDNRYFNQMPDGKWELVAVKF